MNTAPSTAAEGDEPSARADLVASALWITFGAAVAIGAWRMDRLERLNINPYEAPGLVPGLLGALIVLLGLALAGRSVRRGALRPASALAEGTPAAPTASPQALRHMAAGAGLAAVQLKLDVDFAQRQSRRAAVDHAADRRPVRFAEGSDTEQGTQRAARHDVKTPLKSSINFNIAATVPEP